MFATLVRADDHRPGVLLRGRVSGGAADPVARDAPRARGCRDDVITFTGGGESCRLFVGLMALLLGGARVVAARKLEKFPFRLNWTLYGEHAPFFVAREKGFYRAGGAGGRDPGRQRLDHRGAARRQRHQPGGLRRRGDHDARRRRRHADQGGRRDAAAEPDGVHLPRRRGAADQDLRDQGQPHRHHRGRREPRDLHRVHGQARHEGRGRADDHRGQPGGEGAGGAQPSRPTRCSATSWTRARACSCRPA